MKRRKQYKFKTRPYPHQVRALKKLLRNAPEGGAVFAPMRTGKTKIAVDFACCLELKYGIRKVLVAAPLSVLGVWRKQIKIHSPNGSNLQWTIVNYERLYERERWEEKDDEGNVVDRGWEAIESQELYDLEPDLIIVDESHKIGNAESRQSRELYKLQRRCGVRWKVIMTGTPFHRGKKLLVFGQYKFLDESTFGTAFGSFKRRYANFGGYTGYILLGYKNQKEFRKKIAKKAFVMSQVPKVPHQHTVWSYPLEESEEAYAAMANDSYWNGIEAPNPLARGIRLSQLASGVVRSDGRVLQVGREKSRAWAGLLEQLKDNGHDKIVVFSRWIPPMLDAGRVSVQAGYHVLPFHGGVDPTMRERRIDFFQESNEPCVFLAQTSTGALGIDLSAASVAVFYSLPSGLVDYDQDMARIQLFKDKRTLSYYYLCGEGTVEEVQLAALREGIDLVKALERHPDLLNYEVSS
jgi:SNF2 family DNA or RNA helicase